MRPFRASAIFAAVHLSKLPFALIVAVLLSVASESLRAETPRNCLRRVSPSKDAVAGRWTMDSGEALSSAAPIALLLLPAPPRGDYNLRVEFTRESGDGPIGMVLARGELSFLFKINAVASRGSAKAGHASGRTASDPTADEDLGFALDDDSYTGLLRAGEAVNVNNGTRHRLVFKVRRGTVEARLDGRKIAFHKAGYWGLSMGDAPDMESGRLGLVTWNATARFHKVELTQSGAGKEQSGGEEADADNDEVDGDREEDRADTDRRKSARGDDRTRRDDRKRNRNRDDDDRRASQDDDEGDEDEADVDRRGRSARRPGRSKSRGNRNRTSNGSTDLQADVLPLNSRWSGIRSLVPRGTEQNCTMSIIRRRGKIVVMEIREGYNRSEWAFEIRGRRLVGLGYTDLSDRSDVKRNVQASGAFRDGAIEIQYSWFYSNKKYKNALMQGTITLTRLE